jgi:hypothetical protein
LAASVVKPVYQFHWNRCEISVCEARKYMRREVFRCSVALGSSAARVTRLQSDIQTVRYNLVLPVSALLEPVLRSEAAVKFL